MPNPAPGNTIGQYRIEGVIGAGSMGDVFRGIDVDLNRRVAVKILSEKHRDSHELRARFVREGRAVAAIQHPNVVQVFTTGSFDERPFIAMEFLDGTDLGTVIETGGPLPSLRAARAILDAARGLDAAAKAGLIHRDVKPSNLVLLADGRVKVTDFGLAKPVDPGTEPALTALGVVVGTPDYIAPEQARGDPIDERVDIYALGGTLYFLLTGRPPFRTGKPAEDKYLKVVARHLRQPAPDARTVDPEIDFELAELVRAMMAKKPAERPDYPNLVRNLESVVHRLSIGGASPGPPVPRGPEGSGGMVGKTPFVGGASPHGFAGAGPDGDADGGDEAESHATNVRVPTRPPVLGTPPPRPIAPGLGSPGLGSYDGDDAPLVPGATRRGLPGWVIALTVVAIGALIIGVGLFLAGPRLGGTTPGSTPDGDAGVGAPGGAPAPTTDAGPATGAGPDGKDGKGDGAPSTVPPGPTAPAGMTLVSRTDGTPWLFVDAAPVGNAGYTAMFPKDRKAGTAADGSTVISVPYTFARAYCQNKGRRLLVADEWERALATAGVAPSGTLWEWIDGGTDKQKLVRRGKDSKRRPGEDRHADVTFRCALELPTKP